MGRAIRAMVSWQDAASVDNVSVGEVDVVEVSLLLVVVRAQRTYIFLRHICLKVLSEEDPGMATVRSLAQPASTIATSLR